MVVNNLNDPNGGHPAFIDTARGQLRERLLVGLEHEAGGPSEIERVLQTTVSSERMEAARRSAYLSEGRCSL
jgi:hypothetical protein